MILVKHQNKGKTGVVFLMLFFVFTFFFNMHEVTAAGSGKSEAKDTKKVTPTNPVVTKKTTPTLNTFSPKTIRTAKLQARGILTRVKNFTPKTVRTSGLQARGKLIRVKKFTPKNITTTGLQAKGKIFIPKIWVLLFSDKSNAILDSSTVVYSSS